MRLGLFLLVVSLFANTAAPARTHRSRWMRCTATAYSVRGETADGDVTKYRQTIAADPKVIPLGSRVQIQNAGRWSGIYTVTDTGRKVQGNSVDIFIPNAAAAKEFGRKPVRIRVLRVGDEKVGEKEAKSSSRTVPMP
jgi:3D (Asp-Asp-Asp) domain-containing protein